MEPDLRIAKTTKAIKNARDKNPKIKESIPKKFLNKSPLEKLYKTKEKINITKNKKKFFNAISVLSLSGKGSLFFEFVFLRLTVDLFFLTIFILINLDSIYSF